MKSAFFFSLLTLLMGSLLLAQSTRDQLADQTKGLPVAQVRQMGMPQDPLPVRPGFVPTQSGIGFYPAEVRRQTSQAVSFSAAVDYGAVGFAPYAVAIADVNGDGAPDMIVANACTGTTNGVDCATNYGSVVVLLGNGDGTFNPAVTYVSGGYSSLGVAVGDVNGDGKLDIVLINSYAVINGTVSDSESSVSVLLGNGDGTFKPSVSYDLDPPGPETSKCIARERRRHLQARSDVSLRRVLSLCDRGGRPKRRWQTRRDSGEPGGVRNWRWARLGDRAIGQR